ncbi:PLP-dependent cysteine synthase family protein [Roseibium sp. RKSG952]|uniref:PLP-dependent cysteine synthase family protein n=1 Tax=Roseibium sp. RKSG952 TaxID=2529384 RepID=UPI0012BC442D|nr:cysteine synthase family protein [Roseibium sp. RKSG952]MTH95514.1 cysteine synthase family protein [Roseibium sp. RKSG952]
MFQRSLEKLIGKTPIIELNGLDVPKNVRIYAKLEFLNPGGSIKDRVVKYILDSAECDGLLKPGAVIVEATSGNTGAALAMMGPARGHRTILTVPAKISAEKRNVLSALGAEVVVSPQGTAPDSAEHYANAAKRIHSERPGSFMLNQYDSPLNREAHYRTTGPEIYKQLGGQISAFVAAGSTGGTISGVGRYLREKNPDIEIVLLDPVGSLYHTYFHHGVEEPSDIHPYQTEGAGKDRIPTCMDFSVLTDSIRFTDQQAFNMCWWLAGTHGLLVGGTGGANVWGCVQAARKMKGPATIVTVLPDSGQRYLSKIFSPDWLRMQGISVGSAVQAVA